MDQKLTWNFRGIAYAISTVLILIGSLFFPPTRYVWDLIDQNLFLLINKWIATNPLLQNIVAICNYKRFDWVHDLVFLTFFIIYVKNAPREKRFYRIAQILFAILLAAFVILYINKTLLSTTFRINRDSPSLFFPSCTRLSEKVTWLFVKDYSRCSFPADHGTTACLFIGVIHILMGARAGLFATLYALFFVAPRLIVGANWATDILVGSASIAILALAIGYCTPLAELFAQKITKTSQSNKAL